jgi:aspartyl-tRNA(Asn)/glutamyl-tRNA(Gln) amidotransferase subunit A
VTSGLEATLERARAAPSTFITLTAERARREAAASVERRQAGAALGPLDGVPVAWKDLLDVAGAPTTSGSALARDAEPAVEDAPVVARLAAAGMVCVGKTNLSELAYSGLGLNPHFGTPPNPHDPARIPGGSSSGSAVAVATGVVPCAIGTDTSGSIRVPAAFCGIVGFKPTAARVDRTGVQPLSPTLDSVGPLATSVADAIALDALLRGAAPAAADRDAAPVRLVVPEGDLVDDVEPAVAEAFAAAVAALARAGFAIERKSLAALDDARALQAEYGSLVAHEAWRVHRKLLDSADADEAGEADAGDERAARGSIDRRVLRRLRDGRALPAGGRDALLRERPLRQAALAAELGDALTLWPTVRHAAPRLEPLERDDDLFAEVNVGTLRATIPASYLDMPGIALPTGTDAAGLPLSALLSGPPDADDRVLAAALAAEAALRPGARAR